MGAYATDFVEQIWPLSYRGSPRKKFGYPSEGQLRLRIARPAGGYLWDRCAEAKVSYRSYGEWVEQRQEERRTDLEDGKATVKALEGHFDPKFRGFDLDYPDVKRADRFIEELKRFEKEGEMPRLHDPAAAQRPHRRARAVGKPTPTAMVADNDLALGMVVEAVSQEQVLEGDGDLRGRGRRPERPGPRGRPPHAWPWSISPYTKRKLVDSTMYSTSSMLRTMELILGLKPMSQFDAAARPMYHSFTAKPDFTPYAHEVPKADLKAMNVAGAWGADWSEKAEPGEGGPGRRPDVQRGHLEGGEGAAIARCRRRSGPRSSCRSQAGRRR